MDSYFKDAPCVKWKDWAWSLLPFQQSKEPYPLSFSKPSTFVPETLRPRLISTTIEVARELSEFLGLYFYSNTSPYSLVLSPRLILHLLETKQMAGLEIRDQKGLLIACIFEFFMGMYMEKRVGLISWLCVHPQWRKKGITNTLCHAISYDTTWGAEIKWFRNDALFRSSLPPIYSTKIIDRDIRQRTHSYIEKRNFESCKEEFIALWKGANPTGFVFESSKVVPRQCMIWGFEKEDTRLWVLLQPTHEVKRGKGKHGCEILHVVSRGFKDMYEQVQIFEMIVDSLPFDYCECPIGVPHIDALWIVKGVSTWSVVGLHPGYPFQRPVLSLVVS